MALLISADKLEKQMGSKTLFEGLSFGIHEKQKVGLIGPNGSGKSTLLRILSGEETPDLGKVSPRKGLKHSFVKQDESYDEAKSLIETATTELVAGGMAEPDAQVYAPMHLSIVGFEDFEQPVSKLSGGWRKRLSLAIALATEPELLILDEPTNHMDWDGILWLENYLKSFQGAFLLVSHDRIFLNHLCTKTMELNKLYRDGYLAFDCAYEKFLEKKSEYAEAQVKLQSTMSNKARREVEWLRAGVKARTTKSQSRIKEAHQLLDDLADVTARNRAGQSKVRLEVESTKRLSKKLIDFKGLSVGFGENQLIENLNLTLGPKTCLGLLGHNGSGKSSLLKVIASVANNFSGTLFKADDLRIVYFDQKRESLPQDKDLLFYLGDGADSVVFRDQATSVAAYASRLLFPSEKMKMKIKHLSGGEQARLLIGKLFLQPADVLILDEPTNDLDIDSIEILEEIVESFPGLVILVSHDRKFLSGLCHKYLALDGKGGWQIYPDLNQWLTLDQHQEKKTDESDVSAARTKETKRSEPNKSGSKKTVKLSYKEKRQMETIEKDIEIAERELELATKKLEDPAVSSDRQKMSNAVKDLEGKQARVDELYAFWERIEAKFES